MDVEDAVKSQRSRASFRVCDEVHSSTVCDMYNSLHLLDFERFVQLSEA